MRLTLKFEKEGLLEVEVPNKITVKELKELMIKHDYKDFGEVFYKVQLGNGELLKALTDDFMLTPDSLIITYNPKD